MSKQKNNSNDKKVVGLNEKKFVLIVGPVVDEDGEDIGNYARFAGVRKVRLLSKKGSKVRFDMDKALKDFNTTNELTIKDAPSNSSSFTALKFGKAKTKEEQLNIIMHEWVSNLILEEGMKYVGMVNGDPQTLPLGDIPHKLTFNTEQ